MGKEKRARVPRELDNNMFEKVVEFPVISKTILMTTPNGKEYRVFKQYAEELERVMNALFSHYEARTSDEVAKKKKAIAV